MLDHERLFEATASYLTGLVAEASGAAEGAIDTGAPFGELGVDSFRVLKIIKGLEAEFGTLPKTLLFEHFNVDALTRYFVDRHRDALARKFAQTASVDVAAPPPIAPPRTPQAAAVVTSQAQTLAVRLLEADLPNHPELAAQVRELYERHRNEGGVSRGTRNIAPNLFVGSARRGYFNYARCRNLLLVYAYTGPREHFAELAAELHRYCAEKGYQLNFFTDEPVGAIDGAAYSATPFGVVQRVLDLPAFTLEGGAMRRLRYQVSKFEKTGDCRTVEYRVGSDAATDRAVAAVIDAWCAERTMVNPLIHVVRQEIVDGTLNPQHRVFLTWLDGTLQNAILISPLCRELGGYLMDLEFYPRSMPLGGLEFAIVKIIEVLVAEGCTMLSLGGTYGCRLEASPHADPGVDRILDDLHKQNIFNDEGNLQFKNKFRPENRTIHLCRPVGCGNADNVLDIIMMIADPAKMQTSDVENHNVGNREAVTPATAAAGVVTAIADAVTADTASGVDDARATALAEAGFNPLAVPNDRIDFDLKTDSWAQIDAPFVAAQMARLRGQLQQPVNVADSLRAIFPFRHFVLTDAGRTAERTLYKAFGRKGAVLQNLLFPTGLYHQIDNGYTPEELPHPGLVSDGATPYDAANLDRDALARRLAQGAHDVALVCVEVGNNAAGGLPVTLAHLRDLKALLAPHGIPLVLDATRVLDNARLLIDADPAQAGADPWDATRELVACADIVVASLAKNFCVNRGGFVATDDDALLDALKSVLQREGGALDVIDKKLVGLSLKNRKALAAQVAQRVRAVRTVWQTLHDAGVPVVAPVGGHCVLIDVRRIDAFASLDKPVPSFLAWLYVATGIRAGAHSVGMQKGGVLNDRVRLALPLGLTPENADEIAARLVAAFRDVRNVPELALRGGASSSHGDLQGRYDLVRYHRAAPVATAATHEVASNVAAEVEADIAPPAPTVAPAPQPRAAHDTQGMDIAVVGMAGRYPRAKNLHEFWTNLAQGRDCVGDLPAERAARRVRNAYTRDYRGGFIDDVDKFDSLFFNISPREAQVLDPQERLFLEVAWETLEDAGYHPDILSPDAQRRDVGVFVGAVWAMYQIAGVEEKLGGREANPNSFLWSIANRVSYWMNLTGPSLTVDTACSSSLTALYLACEAIRNGDCASALVGGVNLDLHQHKFDINRSGGALSDDGVCRSFGAGANGYVAGEGIGAIYIKPLAQAIADNDHVYGVIRSAVVNHGGRTSGYTVPNPKAQGELVATALRKAGVDARSIGYIEAHGTGTELGDPVEVSGLAQAFAAWGVENGSCAIGSVKTNIGHLEAAAGVVGICKVLLQLRHRELVPSLHSARLNEHIDFANTPFRVQQEREAWTPKTVDGVRQPLRAGVSSFGAGGANAHVVIEEYVAPATVPPADAEHVFVLSARTEEQLREMARRLRDRLEGDAATPLADIAYTLQNGRKSFEHRVAILAGSRRALIERLDRFADGAADADVLAGHAKNADGVTKLLNRRERDEFVQLLARSRDPRKLAQLWIDGLLADCRGLAASGRRTSLPTYPFADKRHWISGGQVDARAAVPGGAALHPLIDSNASTFQRQLFRKTFRVQEFVLRDHVVSGVPTLPGAAYLDLARKAGEIAAGLPVRRIRNVTWISPLTADATTPADALIELKPTADGVLFEISSEATGRRYAQGKLQFAGADAAPQPEYLDLDAIRARCASVIEGHDAYPLFRAVGLDYGPSFRVLERVHKNDAEVLGVLRLPESCAADFDAFVLHPSLVDASMQAGVVGQLGDAEGQMKVPYSIGEIEIVHPLARTCLSYVTRVDDARGSALSRENVTIVDETGRVLVRLRDSVGVPLTSVHEKSAAAPSAAATATEAEPGVEPLYYTTAWKPAPLAAMPPDAGAILLFDVDTTLRDALRKQGRRVTLVLPGERYEHRGDDVHAIDPHSRADIDRVLDALDGDAARRIVFAWSGAAAADADALERALRRGVYAFLQLSQALIARKLSGALQLVYLHRVRDGAPQAHDAAMSGYANTLRLERASIACKVVEVHDGASDTANAVLAELSASTRDDVTVRYDASGRATRTLRRVDDAELAAPGVVLKHRGVYLVTGGAGGLGLVFAEYLARECRARLVLTGRSAPSADIEARLAALRDIGADVLYVAADVSRRDDVERLLAQTRAHYGRLDGVLHAAGVLRDAFVPNHTADDVAAVLAPKVHGTFLLDELTRGDALDFFALFSSLAAFGNVGQCSYAYGNHYLDAFATRREARRARNERHGRTLSLNWSIWAGGGMALDAATQALFKSRLGIRPLGAAFGLEAFAHGLASSYAQLAVLEAERDKIELAWGLAAAAPPPQTAAPTSASGGDLAALVVATLSGLVVDLLKLGASDLALDSVLLDLGFDSVGLATFANAINEAYRIDINPTLFFEYPSIRAIAGVLATEHASAVRERHALADRAPAVAASVPAPRTDAPIAITKDWTPPVAAPVAATAPAFVMAADRVRERFLDKPVAIVGIAGVMPQSSDLAEFWENLANARDLVTEIPRDRWIWEDYDGNPVKEINKANSRWGGFMKEVDKFDPLLFGITPREAEMMDPQQRLFIETAWRAIEDSGHKVSDLAGTKTGVFVGVSAYDYTDVLAENQASLDGFSASGNAHSILANRVSFLFNLRGPSAPIDTACSSSLIALHRAIESIHSGSSDMAIVGGVQVMLTPVGHISLSSAGMLSVDGKCKTFDKDANGYVRGEGAGAILIKPLARAIEDGNPIYAVVRATAENHGGRVTMLTAPNPKAQAELLFEAYDKAHVDPTTVGYVECHGTGTSLGDPIEIQALKKAFSDLYRANGKAPAKTPHCGLSSVKTNIGHLEPAAGIASLLKTLLAMKHRTLPALLHFETLNPYIDLDGSPFYIVDRTMPWPAPRAADGTEGPRRAGVSSFGWGGANAHVVLEEYVPAPRAARMPGPQTIVLSARNEDRLRTYARTLAAHVRTHDVDLADLAYTLKVGRDAMDERLGVVVESADHLVRALDAFAAGERAIDGLVHGRVSRYKRNEQGLSVAAEDGGDDARIAAWIAARDEARLAAAWVEGREVDWAALHAGDGLRRASLPTYPFARDRHWIETGRATSRTASASALHPLVHENASTLDRHCYRSTFGGKEFFFADHDRALPAAAYLEMARAAVAFARPDAASQAIELRDVQWTAGAPTRAFVIDVYAARQGGVGYEIHGDDRRARLRGTAQFVAQTAGKRDVDQLRALMTHGAIDAARLDALRDTLAPRRGPSLHSIRTLHRGYEQWLARLDLPAAVAATRGDYVLHPAILDGAMQIATLAAAALAGPRATAVQPLGVASLCVLAPCTGESVAWVRRARGDIDEATVCLDVDVMDAGGTVCARIVSLAFRVERAAAGGEFVALVDAAYRSDAQTQAQEAPGVHKHEFLKILEEIL